VFVLLMGDIYEICHWDAPGGMRYVRRFIQIRSGVRNMSGERGIRIQTDRQTDTRTQAHRARLSSKPASILQNKENRLKMDLK
jgi:hypothetical protein